MSLATGLINRVLDNTEIITPQRNFIAKDRLVFQQQSSLHEPQLHGSHLL